MSARLRSRAPTPDGYTLLLSPPGPIAMNKLLYKSMPFDSSKWVPISVVASVPYVLAVRNELGVTDVKELVAKAKADPRANHLRVARRRHRRTSRRETIRIRSPASSSSPYLIADLRRR